MVSPAPSTTCESPVLHSPVCSTGARRYVGTTIERQRQNRKLPHRPCRALKGFCRSVAVAAHKPCLRKRLHCISTELPLCSSREKCCINVLKSPQMKQQDTVCTPCAHLDCRAVPKGECSSRVWLCTELCAGARSCGTHTHTKLRDSAADMSMCCVSGSNKRQTSNWAARQAQGCLLCNPKRTSQSGIDVRHD